MSTETSPRPTPTTPNRNRKAWRCWLRAAGRWLAFLTALASTIAAFAKALNELMAVFQLAQGHRRHR
jgi:hypothetical protein